MADNSIPTSYDPIVQLLEDAADGAHMRLDSTGIMIGNEVNLEKGIGAVITNNDVQWKIHGYSTLDSYNNNLGQLVPVQGGQYLLVYYSMALDSATPIKAGDISPKIELNRKILTSENDGKDIINHLSIFHDNINLSAESINSTLKTFPCNEDFAVFLTQGIAAYNADKSFTLRQGEQFKGVSLFKIPVDANASNAIVHVFSTDRKEQVIPLKILTAGSPTFSDSNYSPKQGDKIFSNSVMTMRFYYSKEYQKLVQQDTQQMSQQNQVDQQKKTDELQKQKRKNVDSL